MVMFVGVRMHVCRGVCKLPVDLGNQVVAELARVSIFKFRSEMGRKGPHNQRHYLLHSVDCTNRAWAQCSESAALSA